MEGVGVGWGGGDLFNECANWRSVSGKLAGQAIGVLPDGEGVGQGVLG